MRECKTCGETKPLEDFRAKASCLGGRMPHCRVCDNTRIRAIKRKARARDPEKARADGRRWAAARRKSHPERERAKVREALRQARSGERRGHYLLAGRKKEALRRARKAGALVENVDPAVVLENSNGLCGICHGPLGAEWHLDHIKPLARGGEHSYANTQATHPFCNMQKGARLEE